MPDHATANRAIPRLHRLDAPEGPEPEPSCYGIDVACAAVGLCVLAEFFRARSGFANAPACGLILPGLFFAFSANYRLRARAWCRDQWGRVAAYAAGVGPTPWVAVAAFACLPSWLLYLSNQQTLGAIDTMPVIPSAVSLVTGRDWELSEYFATGRAVRLLNRQGTIPACFQVRPGGVYSSYPAGMVPFAVPVVLTTALCDTELDNVAVHSHLQKKTASIVAAVGVGLFFLLALRLGPPGPAWVTSAILAVASGMFSTVGMGLWQHGGIIFWSLAILLVEFRRGDRPSRWDSALQGFACAQLVTCRLTSIAFLVPFGLWVLLRAPRRASAVVGCAAIAYAPWAWFYWNTYGNPFGPSTGFLAGYLWTLDLGTALQGVLIGPGRGLLIYQPWILLGLAWLVPWVRGRIARLELAGGPRGWAWFCGAVVLLQVLLISAWGCWWGGWCWGSRLVVDVVPLCALLCVRPIAGLWCSRSGRAVVVAMGLLGASTHVPGVYLDGGRWNVTADFPADALSWSRPPFLEWTRRR